MKDTLRQVLVALSVLVTLIVNTLANALPLNGQNTGQISDRFHVYFVPAGYVFAIWGLIYIGLVAYAVYQALPAQRENPRLRKVGWWVILGGLANSAWIFFWHFQLFPLTLLAMLVLLGSLIVTYLSLGADRFPVSTGEQWAVRIPFSIYLGWITVATVANVTDVLDYLKWDGFGISAVAWMGIVLFAVVVIAALMSFTRHDLSYTLVLLWALVGITVKQSSTTTVVLFTWIAFSLVVISFIAARLFRRLQLRPVAIQ